MTFITNHDFMKSHNPPILRSTRRRFTKKLRKKALKAGMDEASTERLLRYIRRCYIELYQPEFKDGFDSDGTAFGPEEIDDDDDRHELRGNEEMTPSKRDLPNREKKRKRQLTDGDGNGANGTDVRDKSRRKVKRRSEEGLRESRHRASPEGKGFTILSTPSPREPDRGDSPLVLDLLKCFAESPTDSPARAKYHDPLQKAEKSGPTPDSEFIVVEDDDMEDQPETGQSVVGEDGPSDIDKGVNADHSHWFDGAAYSTADYIPFDLEEESAPSDTAQPEAKRGPEFPEEQSSGASSDKKDADTSIPNSNASRSSTPPKRRSRKEKNAQKRAKKKAKERKRIRARLERNAQRRAKWRERKAKKNRGFTSTLSEGQQHVEHPNDDSKHSGQAIKERTGDPATDQADGHNLRGLEHEKIPAVDLTQSDSGF